MNTNMTGFRWFSKNLCVLALSTKVATVLEGLIRNHFFPGVYVQRGDATALRIPQKKGVFFKTSACPRFVKEGHFFVPRYEV